MAPMPAARLPGVSQPGALVLPPRLWTVDQFNGPAATDLAARAQSLGRGWTNLTSGHGTLLLDGSGGVYSPSGAANAFVCYGSGAMPTPDYYAQAAITVKSGIDRAFVMVRSFSAAGECNGYGWGVRADGTPGFRLGRITNDNFVNLASPPQAVPTGPTMLFTLLVVGTLLLGYLDGQLLAAAQDTAFAGPGQAGLAHNTTAIASPTTGPISSRFQAGF